MINALMNMSNPGKEYEEFVFNKLTGLFPELEVTLDDNIVGTQSGVRRQIDISIKGQVSGVDILYLVQCKDYTRRADINKVGELSSVMQDVGASKGFLICSGGFTRTIHQYAQKLGIELWSVEDVNSSQWHVEKKIPVIYIQKQGKSANVNLQLIPIPEMYDRLEKETHTNISAAIGEAIKEVSLDEGRSSTSLVDYINHILSANNIDFSVTPNLELNDPNLKIRIWGIWTPVSFKVQFNHEKKYYLKYITPEEYSQIRDHITQEATPLNFLIDNFSIELDDSYVEVDPNEIPISNNLSIKLEIPLTIIESLNFRG
ncbi:restriction endonuclease [Tellurirhabdus bombi]|uniref:restriction endonuclease n=1 Tax=Tellurirhabdus bombi TaxID=2907205 RepID=UPI001F34684F|nr:restriction endonuclease [Tellurirhabdus bombi]